MSSNKVYRRILLNLVKAKSFVSVYQILASFPFYQSSEFLQVPAILADVFSARHATMTAVSETYFAVRHAANVPGSTWNTKTTQSSYFLQLRASRLKANLLWKSKRCLLKDIPIRA